MSLPNTQYLLNTPTGVKENSVCHLCPDSFIGALNTLNIDPMTRKRASSFKRDKHLDFFQDEGMRPRTSSAPTKNTLRKPKLHRTNLGLNIQPDYDQYTVRSFKMNSKGIIVVGDSMRSRSANSLNLLTGEMCQFCPLSRTSSTISPDSVATSPGSVTNNTGFPSRVLVFGSSSVGKTALTQQFMTSEYLGGFDTSVGDSRRAIAAARGTCVLIQQNHCWTSERLEARTLRHDSNNVLTNQRKRFTAKRYTDLNIYVDH